MRVYGDDAWRRLLAENRATLARKLRVALDNFSSVDLISGDAADIAPLLDAIPPGWAKTEDGWVELTCPRVGDECYL